MRILHMLSGVLPPAPLLLPPLLCRNWHLIQSKFAGMS
jgi:hypothetical protein